MEAGPSMFGSAGDGPLASDAAGKPGWAWRVEKKRRGKKPKHQQ